VSDSVGAFILATTDGTGTAFFLSAPVLTHVAIHIFKVILEAV